MKKFINKQMFRAMELKSKAITKLKDKSGLSHTTEILLWSAGSAAAVLICIGLFVLLIKSDLFPGLAGKLKEIFNFK